MLPALAMSPEDATTFLAAGCPVRVREGGSSRNYLSAVRRIKKENKMPGQCATKTPWLYVGNLLRRVAGTILLGAFAWPAFATTYTFTSPNYTSTIDFTTPCTAGNCQNYTTAMHVTGSFTTASPLAANLVGVDVRAQVTSFSFSDGINTFANTDPKVRFIGLQLSTDASGVPIASNTYIVFQQWESGSGPHTGGGVDRFNELFVDPNADDFNNRGCNTVGTDSGVADSCLGPVPFDPNASEASNSTAGNWTVTGGGGPAPTTTTLATSANPSTFGQSITFTATVTGNSPTGTIQFNDGATLLGTATLSGGVATFATASLAVGSHSITAVYGGDANNAGSTSPAVAEVVNAAVVTTQQPIPTLSEAMLALLAGLVVAVAALRRR